MALVFFISNKDFIEIKTEPSTQETYYGCKKIKIPNYNDQSRQREKKRNKFVKLDSTRTKNRWRARLWDQNPMSARVVYH